MVNQIWSSASVGAGRPDGQTDRLTDASVRKLQTSPSFPFCCIWTQPNPSSTGGFFIPFPIDDLQ